MRRYSENYKRKKHPFIIRLIAIWRIITCRNFILIDFEEFIDRTQPARQVRPLYRSDYDAESEALALKAAYFMTENKIKKVYDHDWEIIQSTHIKQGLVEVIADYLDSEEVLIAEAINGMKDPEPREKTDLHIRMAEAAMEVYLRTVK